MAKKDVIPLLDEEWNEIAQDLLHSKSLLRMLEGMLRNQVDSDENSDMLTCVNLTVKAVNDVNAALCAADERRSALTRAAA